MKGLTLILVAVLTGLSGTAANAQDGDAGRAAAVQDATYSREVFVFPANARRNPFTPPGDDAGPNFENLDLVGIVFAGSGGSVATVIDRASEQRYRVRRGDVIGNARVVEVRPDALVFQVTVFGVTRVETLEISEVMGTEGN